MEDARTYSEPPACIPTSYDSESPEVAKHHNPPPCPQPTHLPEPYDFPYNAMVGPQHTVDDSTILTPTYLRASRNLGTFTTNSTASSHTFTSTPLFAVLVGTGAAIVMATVLYLGARCLRRKRRDPLSTELL
jgi:hypothetical protein